MKKENWKPIVGYEGYYEVSNLGRVRSINYHRENKIGIITPKRRGKYFQVVLSKNSTKRTYRINRLVAFAFPEICGEWFDGAVCNHKDLNTFNNDAENLEWCTIAYNNAYDNAYEKRSKALNNRKDLSIAIEQYDLNKVFIKYFPSINEASRTLGISKSNIISCCKLKRKTAGGYIFKYAKTEPI